MIDATDIKAHPTACSLNKGRRPRLIGGTKGGMTSKLHGVCDSKDRPLRLHLSEVQCSDFTGADVVRKDLPPAATVIGDQGYDRDKIRKMLSQQGITPCMPPRCCRKKPVHYSKRLDRKRHKTETLFVPTEGRAAHCNPLRRLLPTSSVLPSSWPPPSSSGMSLDPKHPSREAIRPHHQGVWGTLRRCPDPPLQTKRTVGGAGPIPSPILPSSFLLKAFCGRKWRGGDLNS